jgi:hypothetical protein
MEVPSTSACAPWCGAVLFAATVAGTAGRRLLRAPEASKPQRTLRLPCTVSSPGKVLLAGGYLVLEPENIGITVAATARFYVSVSLSKAKGEAYLPEGPLRIAVVSPQFYSTYDYVYDFTTMDLQLSSAAGNAFVAKCLSLVLLFSKEWFGAPIFSEIMQRLCSEGTLTIKLQADNDFYSHIKELKTSGLPLLTASLNSIPRLSPCHRDEKTGEVTTAHHSYYCYYYLALDTNKSINNWLFICVQHYTYDIYIYI